MIAFSIDTSSIKGSLALQKKLESGDIKLLSKREWQRQKSHSEVVTELTEEAFKEARLKPESVNRIFVSIGPGSFTGLRVAVNLARALSYSGSGKIISANTLRILAEPAIRENIDVIVLNNAFKHMVYCAAYDKKGNTLIEPCALTLDGLRDQLNANELASLNFTSVGDGYEIYKTSFHSDILRRLSRNDRLSDYPCAQTLGQICLSDRSPGPLLSWNELVPLYIRASEAEERLRDGLLKPLPKL